jgi:hypothetical protein
MKILFISYHGNKCDWLADSLLHGLLSLNYNVEQHPVASRLYKSKIDEDKNDWQEEFKNNYFKTIEGFVPKQTDVKGKIEYKYYDLIIYGCYNFTNTYDELVAKLYHKNQVIYVDGADENSLSLLENRIGKGILFKRELLENNKNIFPIEFAYPKEKIFQSNPTKKIFSSSIVPGNYDTYVTTSLKDYCEYLQSSIFALTYKKSGWDCMRHYDIIFNKCLPLFQDIEYCPQFTMINHKKNLYKQINNYYQKNINKKIEEILKDLEYIDISTELFEHACNFHTSEYLAKYVMSKI